MTTIYKLPEELRKELSEPLGAVIQEKELARYIRRDSVIVSVGDVVTATLYRYGYVPDVALVDYKTRRNLSLDSRKWGERRRIIKISNPAGTITEEIWKAIADAYARLPEKTLIEVEGEEDLAALACTYLASGNYIIVYGMPGKGITIVTPGAEEKKKVAGVLAKMKV